MLRIFDNARLLFDQGGGVLKFATTLAPLQALFEIPQLAAMAWEKAISAISSRDKEITMFPVDSSNIKAISHAPDARVLQVNFLTCSLNLYFSVDRPVMRSRSYCSSH